MAIKTILKYGTESLRQPSKEVHKVSKKITESAVTKQLLQKVLWKLPV